MVRPFRVLVLDDEERWRKELTRSLSHKGFHVDAAGSPSEAMELLRRGFYHLLVLDVSMEQGDHDNTDGMKFLKQLEDGGESGALKVIVLSGYGTLARAREAFVQLHVVDFQAKQEFDNRQFVQRVEEIFSRYSEINLDLTIRWQGVKSAADACLHLKLGQERLKKDHPLLERVGIELEDLLCRLFHDADLIRVEPMQRGRSGAGVLRVQRFYAGGEGRSMVVKFGEVASIERERQNFEKFVRPFLGGGRSTNLERAKRTPLLGGLSYSLLGTADDEFEDFGGYYRRAQPAQVRAVLDHLFSNTCASWYASTGPLRLHDLSAEYEALLGLSPEKLEEPLRRGLKAVQGKDELHFESLTARRTFPNPVVAIAERTFDAATYTCTTHGDLNASNVLVDRAGATWLIDFLRTGPGHILRDFAQLDATVRILLLDPEEATLDERLEMEQALLTAQRFHDLEGLFGRLRTSNPALAKAFAMAIHLRQLAARQVSHNPRADLSEYYVALLYFSLNLIRFWDLPTLQREHALLAASLLAERLGR